MLRGFGILMMAVLVMATWTYAQEVEPAAPAPEAAPAKTLAVVGVGDVDAALVQRVFEFVRFNAALPCRLLPAAPAAGGALDAEGVAAAKLMGPDDVAMVALVAPLENITSHGVFLPDNRVAVVNVPSLDPGAGDVEKHSRRVEREAMQSVGMLLGLPSCPNPQCAMWAYATDEELDAKGRNYCPPCLEKIQGAAKERGMQMDAASPFAVQ